MNSRPPRILALTIDADGSGLFALPSEGAFTVLQQPAGGSALTVEDLKAADFVIVDGRHDDPFGVVRRVRRIDPGVQVGVLVPDLATRTQVVRARQLATGAGEVWLVEPGQLASAAVRAAEVTDQRRRFQRTVIQQPFSGSRQAARQPGHLSSAYLAALLETIPVGVITVDGQDRIVGWNHTAARIFGRQQQDVIGTPVADLFTPESWTQVATLLRRAGAHAASAGTRAVRVSIRRADGAPGVVEADTAVAAAGGLRMRSLVLHDVSERERLERQVQEAQRMEAVGRLAGGAAHEINNALQGVLGFAHLSLRSVSSADPVREDLEQVVRAGQRAASVTRGLLAFGRRQLLRPAPLDLARLVEEFAPMLRQSLGPERELELHLPGVPVTVLADPSQLEQVLLNLALNARDAMAAGGRLSVRLDGTTLSPPLREDLGLSDRSSDRFARLEVADTGCGMDEATLGTIFEPFFTTKPVGQGTGLGLAVVHGIVHQSGGVIAVRSAVGIGTAFTIYLPAEEVAGSEAAVAPPAAFRRGREHVLVVDDEPTVRDLAARILQDAGYRTTTAEEGAEALRQIEHARANDLGPVELVLTDLIMPGIGGRELADRLAAFDPPLPVLVMSGHATEAAPHAASRPDDVFWVQKPFDPETLLERVRWLLDRRTAAP